MAKNLTTEEKLERAGECINKIGQGSCGCGCLLMILALLLLLVVACNTGPATGWKSQDANVVIREMPTVSFVLRGVVTTSATDAERLCVFGGAATGAVSLDATSKFTTLTEDARARIAVTSMLNFMKKSCPECLKIKTPFQMIKDVTGVKQKLSDAEVSMLIILSMRAKLHGGSAALFH